MDLDTTDATDSEIIKSLYESKWVEYEYISTKNPDGIVAGDTFFLDLETFIDHTTRH